MEVSAWEQESVLIKQEDKLLQALYSFIAGKSKYTAMNYKTAIQLYIDFLGGDHFTILTAEPFQITQYKKYLLKDHSVSTVGNRLSAISSMYSYLVKAEMIDRNPVQLVDRGDIKINPYENAKTITIEQFRAILEEIPESVSGIRDRAIFLMIYLSGLRRSSVLNLTGSDISFQNDKVYFKTRLKGGSFAKKELPLPVWQIIKYYLQQDKRELKADQCIFLPTTTAGDILIDYHCRKRISKGLSSELLNQKFKRYAKRAGISNVSVHSLRHLGASMHYQASKDILETMRFLNHKHINTTQVYLHALNGEEHNHWQAMMAEIY